MAVVKQKHLILDDTMGFVFSILEDRPEISLEGLKEIARLVSGIDGREAKRTRILELADEFHGDAPKG